MIIEFTEQDSLVFDEIMKIMRSHSNFEYVKMNDDSILSVPGLDIYPSRRKIYRGRKEISLTAKEYDLFYLLVVNRGQVLTYEQIYQNVWGDEAIGKENNAVKCYIRNLREKLFKAIPDAAFAVRCVREVGYCFDVNPE